MTAKQLDFIRSLASERDLERAGEIVEGAYVEEALRKAAYVERLVAGNAPEPSTAQASQIIEFLMLLPRKAGAAPRTNGADPELPEGRYAIELGGVLRFFKVDRPTEGRWAGRQFLSEVIGGESRGRAIREAGEKRSVYEALASDPDEAIARYGREIGRCGYCHVVLTEELSRESGVGPDCAKQRGIDRKALVAALVETERPGHGDAGEGTASPAAPDFNPYEIPY